MAKASNGVASHSHFLQPIDRSPGSLAGNSRSWGDADEGVKSQVKQALIASAKQAGYSKQETAFLLALVHYESGFNPDAAAKRSSATGLGQFIDRTGAHYGIEASSRFSLSENIKAVVQHSRDNLKSAAKRCLNCSQLERFELAYALHHDGPTLAYGGLERARSFIAEQTAQFSRWLKNW